MSLNAPINSNGATAFDEFLESDMIAPEDFAELSLLTRRTRKLVNEWPGLEKEVILRMYGLTGESPKTGKAVSEELKISAT
ncbi:hypothetical protein ABTD78_21720, partial [Acinetobacter baumannii]